jgi:hypothetical protein
MRRSTLEDWLAEPENPEPAHDPATQYVPAPANVQRVVRHANEAGIRVVSVAEFRRTPTSRPRVRAPREARNARRRGSRRGERATSSSSDDPDPEPPAARPCACGCGRPRQPGKGQNYFDPVECKRRHARERKRAQRARDRREGTERHVERRLKARPLAALGPEPCKCQPRPGFAILDPEGDLVCCACGRHRVMPRLKRVNGFDASAVQMQQLDRLGSPRTKRGEVAA